MPKIEDGIWPAFPSDLMSVAIVLATQARGSMLFFEKMFESRMYFVDRLIEMGAQIVQCDPHRVVVQGPGRLHGTHVSQPRYPGRHGHAHRGPVRERGERDRTMPR